MTTPATPPVLYAEPGRPPEGWPDVLAERGALVVRGLGVTSETAATAFGLFAPGGLLPESEAFAPRLAQPGGALSPTPWPAHQPMCMHHELSYAIDMPGLVLLGCVRPAQSGGSVGLADAAAVAESLPADLVDRFARDGWLLTRTFLDDIGASIADAYGSDDRTAVEDWCRSRDIDVTWLADGLRTRQRRPALIRHPVSGLRCWVNQVAFLSRWTLEPEVREFLADEYGPDHLPFDTSYGDGTPIGRDVVDLVAEAYDTHTVRVQLAAGDLLVIDNLRTAHSRDPYEGRREVLVGLAEPVRLTSLDTRVEAREVTSR